jgi:hypothetical protein
LGKEMGAAKVQNFRTSQKGRKKPKKTVAEIAFELKFAKNFALCTLHFAFL